MPLAGAHHFGACGVCGGTHTSRDDPTAARGDCSFIQRAIVSQNLDGIIRTRNQAAERLFGYTVEEVIGRPITMLVPAEDIREEADILKRIRRVTALNTMRPFGYERLRRALMRPKTSPLPDGQLRDPA
jgi:PAS domain-containing protein